MLNSIKKNSNNYLIYQPTPWNFQTLGFFSNEIKNFVFDDIEVACKMLKEFDAICLENEIRFSAIRFNANNHSEKYVLSKFNYYYAESTYVLNKKLVNLYNLSSAIPKLKLDIELKSLINLSENEVIEILAIAGSTFYHGRFAEDYNFGKKISDKRNEHWIKNERNGSNEIFILKSNNIVVGFMMFSIKNETVSLLLGGLLEKYRLYAYSFWFKILEQLKNREIQEVSVLISAANIPAVNIYSFFEFKFSELLIGFHKYHIIN